MLGAEQVGGQLRIPGGDDASDVGERDVEVAQPPDDQRVRELAGVVGAIARVRVHRARHEQPVRVIGPQRLDRDEACLLYTSRCV